MKKKRPDSTHNLSAWAGCVISIGSNGTIDGTFVLTSQERWDKALSQDAGGQENFGEGPLCPLQEIIRADSYMSMARYLMGFHITINSWRKG
jgi:hypothetical protein